MAHSNSQVVQFKIRLNWASGRPVVSCTDNCPGDTAVTSLSLKFQILDLKASESRTLTWHKNRCLLYWYKISRWYDEKLLCCCWVKICELTKNKQGVSQCFHLHACVPPTSAYGTSRISRRKNTYWYTEFTELYQSTLSFKPCKQVKGPSLISIAFLGTLNSGK